jgi:maleylacetate reductase
MSQSSIMHRFIYDQPAARVVFGAGSLDQLPEEVKRLGAQRAIVLATPEQRNDAEDAARRLGSMAAGVFAEAVMHVPIETARAGREFARRNEADCCVAIGGGSTIGLGKAIALESSLPIVAVPTTYAGSEMTSIYGIMEGGLKKTGRDRRVLPKTVIYDPVLTLTLPPNIAGPSGMNAIAHCVEALYAPDTNPIINIFAAEGIRAFARSLPDIVRGVTDLDLRADAQYGAWLAGTALGATTMGIHHKLCHTLGGMFNLSHADTHTVILPHAVAYKRDSAPEAMRVIADALGVEDPIEGLYDLAVRMGAPVALKDIGMPPEGLDRAAAPLSADYPGVRQLLQKAYHGLHG